MSEAPANSPVTSLAVNVPAVLAPVTIATTDTADAMIEAVAAAGAGATGIELSFAEPQLALTLGIGIADHLAEVTDLPMFLRTDVPLASGPHTRICQPATSDTDNRRTGRCVTDLGIDSLDARPDATEVADRWPEVSAAPPEPFMISTIGFDPLAEAELMALATVATVRGATAITCEQVRVARRVVDTVSAVLDAREAR